MKLFSSHAFIAGEFVPALITIENDRITDVDVSGRSADADRVFDSGFLIPGLLDLQINGFAGVDFSTANRGEIDRAMAALPATGTTAICPTVITSPWDGIADQLKTLSSDTHGLRAARNLGAHLEGPFISGAKLGAHDPDLLARPDQLAELEIDLSLVRIMTLAPELPGAIELIRKASRAGCLVSVGHTSASYTESMRAFDAGAKMATHLFNGMSPLHHREIGTVGAVLSDLRTNFSLIVDGEHVAYELLAMVLRLAGDRAIVVSDASAALFATPGSKLTLGGADLVVDSQGSAKRPDGTLASSGMTQLEAIEKAVNHGLSRTQLLASATAIPAKLLGRSDLGEIKVGALADLVHYSVEQGPRVDLVLVGGEPCLA